MQETTLAVAFLGCVLVIALPPRWGIVAYVAALVWYPAYLTVGVGSLDFSVTRIVILALLARILVSPGALDGFRWNWVDRMAVVAVAAECVAGLMTVPAGLLLENRAGAAFNTLLPYFAVRLTLHRREDYLAALKGVLLVTAPLAAFGVYESVTGHNVFAFMRDYSTWPAIDITGIERRGYYRAFATFSHSIMFGLCFAMVAPVCAGLWPHERQKGLIAAGLALAALGLMSSMSSGPWIAGLVTGAALAFYPARRYWKVAVTLLVLWVAAVDVASNRQWYYVFASYASLDPSTGFYRIELIQEAFGGGMSGHWLLGHGAVGAPGQGSLDWAHADITNQYILILARYGLVGVLPFVALIAAAFASLRRAWTNAANDADRWMTWCVMSSVVGMTVAMMTVSLFGQPETLLYMTFALCAVLPEVVARASARTFALVCAAAPRAPKEAAVPVEETPVP